MKSRFPKTALFLKHHKRKRRANDNEEGSVSMTQSLSDSLNFREATEHQKLKEEECLRNLRVACRSANMRVSDSFIFRFACYYNFDYNSARNAIYKKFDDPYLHLRMEGELMQQFQNVVVYPLPDLMTKNKKHELLYFRGCRHFPSEMSTELLIQNVLYVFNHMSMTKQQCRNGVAIIVDLDKWTFKNFTPECSFKFLKAVQHQVPTKVASIFIVNAPRWFPKVYRHVLRKAMTSSFAKTIHVLKHQTELQDKLMDGYEKFLPVEMGYWCDSAEIVEDFVDMKVYAESNC